jgi:hypothetical protein
MELATPAARSEGAVERVAAVCGDGLLVEGDIETPA